MERDDVVSLQDYLVVLKRQRWLIVTTTVLVVVAAVGVSLAQTPLYEGETEVVVEPVRRTQDVSLEELLSPQGRAVETERLVMTSRPVAERAAEAVGTTDLRALLDQVRVETVRDTQVVRVIATDPDPARAADIADAFAEAYLDLRRDQAVEGLLAARANLEERADALREQISELDAEVAPAEDEEEAGNDVAAAVERDALIAQLAQVSAQIAELGDGTDNITGGGTILSPAEVPTAPVSPQPVRTGALALVLGLLLGTGFAFLRDHIDDVVRDEADFKRATGGLPVLGRIPHWDDPAGGERLVTLVEPTSLASEAYRELSASVRFLLVAATDDAPDAQPGGRSILITSSLAGDGKTSTASNLAVAAARIGLRTILVDADLRRPAIASRFGSGRTSGLSDALLAGGEVAGHVLDVGSDSLLVVPAGTIPPNPNELLASAAMRTLHRRLVGNADLVIYDTPAVLAVPDALELGRYVDLPILVGRAGVTGRRQVASTIERLRQVGAEVQGTVLNDIDAKSDGYYYRYYYDEPKEAEKPTRRRGWRSRRTGGSADELNTALGSLPATGRAPHVPPPSEPSRGAPPADGPGPDRPPGQPADRGSLFGRRQRS